MDIISNLPDELRVRIISSLTTKEAISTSVLSKRWKEVWIHLPNLDFNIRSCSQAILDSVDGMLDRLKSPEVENLILVCDDGISRETIAKWIGHAVRLNAQDIDLDVVSLELPLSFFTCKSLVSLRLLAFDPSSITVPEDFCLPNLKNLQFVLSSPPMELTKKLFRNCPKLEELELGASSHYEDQVYDISSLSLKVLEINLCGVPTYVPKVILNVPNIDTIHLNEWIAVELVVQGPLEPDHATISQLECCDDSDSQEDGDRAYRHLNTLSRARSMILDYSICYVLSKFHLNNDVPTLNHLTYLDMRLPRLCGWTILFNILDNSPNLQDLTIMKDCEHYENSPLSIMDQIINLPEDFDWTDPHTPPTCLLLHLEEIELFGYFWMNCDMKAIKYLLTNARVLKRVICRARRSGVKEATFWKEVDNYAKSLPSRSYEISFK